MKKKRRDLIRVFRETWLQSAVTAVVRGSLGKNQKKKEGQLSSHKHAGKLETKTLRKADRNAPI